MEIVIFSTKYLNNLFSTNNLLNKRKTYDVISGIYYFISTTITTFFSKPKLQFQTCSNTPRLAQLSSRAGTTVILNTLLQISRLEVTNTRQEFTVLFKHLWDGTVSDLKIVIRDHRRNFLDNHGLFISMLPKIVRQCGHLLSRQVCRQWGSVDLQAHVKTNTTSSGAVQG